MTPSNIVLQRGRRRSVLGLCIPARNVKLGKLADADSELQLRIGTEQAARPHYCSGKYDDCEMLEC